MSTVVAYGPNPAATARELLRITAAQALPASSVQVASGAGVNGFTVPDAVAAAFTAAAALVDSASYDGFLTATSVAALPTASAAYRGALALVPGAASVADTVYVCLRGADQTTYSWKLLLAG